MAKRTVTKTVRRGSFLNRYGRTYSIKDHDPAIDKIRTLLEDEGVKVKEAAVLSNVGLSTIDNWFNGSTKRPQHTTLAAVASGLGFDWELQRKRSFDMKDEMAKATRWNESYQEKLEAEKAKKNGHGKK